MVLLLTPEMFQEAHPLNNDPELNNLGTSNRPENIVKPCSANNIFLIAPHLGLFS
jgi:hypothetical protein